MNTTTHSRCWFTSDLHFGHVNILEYAQQRVEYLGLKPGATVTDMNEGIVRLWNGQVAPEDYVYLIGDVAMGRVAETIEYVRRLNGTIFLVPGNHDRIHPIMHKSDEQTVEWKRHYADVGLVDIGIGPHVWNIDGIKTTISHFPYTGDHSQEERYGEWRPPDNGMPIVHGHVHDLYQTSGVQFNVGIDAWEGRFITPEEIGDYFRSLGFQN